MSCDIYLCLLSIFSWLENVTVVFSLINTPGFNRRVLKRISANKYGMHKRVKKSATAINDNLQQNLKSFFHPNCKTEENHV